MTELHKAVLPSTRGDAKMIFTFKKRLKIENHQYFVFCISIVGKEWPCDESLDANTALSEQVEDHDFELSNISIHEESLEGLIACIRRWVTDYELFDFEVCDYVFQKINVVLQPMSTDFSDIHHPILYFNYEGTKIKGLSYGMSIDQSCVTAFCNELKEIIAQEKTELPPQRDS